MKVKFNDSQKLFLRSNADILLKNSGAKYVKETAQIFELLDNNEEIELNTENVKMIQLICDIALKAHGLLQLQETISLLNAITTITKKE